MIRTRSAVLCFLAIASLQAATTTTWEMNTYQDFLRGRFTGVSLDRDGKLTLAPKLETVFSSGQSVIWSVAEAPDGSLYAATGHRGRVYRIDKSGGPGTLVWTSDQPEVFAIAVDAQGVLYAATSPDGKVYRIEKGKATEFYAPQAKYIWSLGFSKDGSLFVGTGGPANVYRVDKSGKGELYYETGQSHVTALAFDANGNVLAGTEPNGILYRISARDKAFVLYDANLPEIRSIVSTPDGTVYAAALGGSVARICFNTKPVGVLAHQRHRNRAAHVHHCFRYRRAGRRRAQTQGGHIQASGPDRAGCFLAHQSAGGDSGRRKIGGVQNQSRFHGGDAVEFQGRERLQHAGGTQRRRSFSPPISKGACTGCIRIANRRCWWKRTKGKPRGWSLRRTDCWRPPATWANSSAWATGRERAAATNRRCTIREPWRTGGA